MKRNKIYHNIKFYSVLYYLILILISVLILAYRSNAYSLYDSFNFKIFSSVLILILVFASIWLYVKIEKASLSFKSEVIKFIKISNLGEEVDKKSIHELNSLQKTVSNHSELNINLINTTNLNDCNIGIGWSRSLRSPSIIYNFIVWHFPHRKNRFKTFKSYLVFRTPDFSLKTVFGITLALDFFLYSASVVYLEPIYLRPILNVVLISIPLMLVLNIVYKLEHILIAMNFYRHELDQLIYLKNKDYKLNLLKSTDDGTIIITSLILNHHLTDSPISQELLNERAMISEIFEVINKYLD